MQLPPRIEKWVMGIQEVDFELIYEPGKDDADPLDFLSKHALPEKGKDDVERVIKYVLHVKAEHAVVVDQIKEESCKDTKLLELSVRILTEDWEHYKKDPDIAPFYSVQNELYAVDGLLFRIHESDYYPQKPTETSHQGRTPPRTFGNDQNKANVTRKVLVSNHEQYDRTDHWPMS